MNNVFVISYCLEISNEFIFDVNLLIGSTNSNITKVT